MIGYFSPVVPNETVLNSDFVTQDTLKLNSDTIRKSVPQDSGQVVLVNKNSSGIQSGTTISDKNDTVSNSINNKSVIHSPKTEFRNFDTTSVCQRNSIADITYFNPDFVIRSIDQSPVNRFPYLFTGNNIRIRSEEREYVIKHLREGRDLPQKIFHDDWVIGIVLVAAILFALVQSTSKSFIPGITRFFLFRGTKEEGVRELAGIFQWQSTVLNFSSFVVISLFAYFAVSYFSIIPENTSGIMAWLVALLVVVAALTLRHIVCVGTAFMSGQKEVFRDYLHTVYQFYRFGALLLFMLVIMMAYTRFLPEKSYFIIGAVLLFLLYLIRISRLLIIFINRNISIFYLILYLCALEILPVLVSIKYFSGLA